MKDKVAVPTEEDFKALSEDQMLGCIGLWIPDDKNLYDSLHENKEEIEDTISFPLIWERLDGKKGATVCARIKGLNFKKQDNYQELMDQTIDYVVSMRSVFKPYILKRGNTFVVRS